MIEVNSEIEITLHVIGGKYKPLILYLLMEETLRFKEIYNKIEGISKKTLTNQLKDLESFGLITRHSYNEVPPRVDYTITDKGLSLYNILENMCKWGADNKEGFTIINPQCDE